MIALSERGTEIALGERMRNNVWIALHVVVLCACTELPAGRAPGSPSPTDQQVVPPPGRADSGQDGGTTPAPPPPPTAWADAGTTLPGGDAGSGEPPGPLTPNPVGSLPQPACAWNEAYEEDGKMDSVSAILAGAQGCYVLLDPFSSSEARNAIAQLKSKANLVSCYMSSGSCEDWRDDYAATKPFCGPAYPGWAGEYFVSDTQGMLPLMKARIDKMATWGCQCVEFDNMDWAMDAGNSAGVAPADAKAYNQALCAHARARGMLCMAKSTTEGAEDFDGLTVESYTDDMEWWSQSDLADMLAKGGIGLVVHYNESDCDGVYSDYKATYGAKLSFICSDSSKYRHYNAP